MVRPVILYAWKTQDFSELKPHIKPYIKPCSRCGNECNPCLGCGMCDICEYGQRPRPKGFR